MTGQRALAAPALTALWRLERALRRSDPDLSMMLAIFARLTAGEAIASIKLGNAVRRWIGLAGLDRMLTAVAACLSAGSRWAVSRIGLICAETRWRFRGSVRRAVGLASGSRLHGGYVR